MRRCLERRQHNLPCESLCSSQENEALDKFSEPDIPRSVKKETKYLVTSVYSAEDLPFLDSGSVLSSSKSMDASVTVEFGSKKMTSKVVSVTSSKSEMTCSPCFNSEIWLPISYPSISSTLTIQVWDQEGGIGEKELVATYKCNMFNVTNETDKVRYSDSRRTNAVTPLHPLT